MKTCPRAEGNYVASLGFPFLIVMLFSIHSKVWMGKQKLDGRCSHRTSDLFALPLIWDRQARDASLFYLSTVGDRWDVIVNEIVEVNRKGSLSAFRPKEAAFEVAEAFRQKFTFRPKEQFQQKIHILAEMTFFWLLSAKNFYWNKLIVCRNCTISAEFACFGSFRSFRLVLVSFGFRPKLRLLKSTLSVWAETLSVDLYEIVGRLTIG